MSSRHRSFDASARNRRREPLTFDLVYERYKGPRDDDGNPTEPENGDHWRSESASFKCKGWLPALTMLEMGDTWQPDQGVSLKGIQRMFETCLLTRTEYDRWLKVLGDEDVQVEAQQLGEISQWLFETYNGRPTGGSTDSSRGPSQTGNGSTVPVQSNELTP